MTEDDIENVGRIARRVRSFLEPRWAEIRIEEARRNPSRPDQPLSWNQCRRSSAFLKAVLELEMPGSRWMIEGGKPSDTEDVDIDLEIGPLGGFDDGMSWNGHYWVTDEDYEVLVDITADQFGRAPVVIETEHNPSYRANFWPLAIEEHVRDVQWRVDAWLEEWKATSRIALSPTF